MSRHSQERRALIAGLALVAAAALAGCAGGGTSSPGEESSDTLTIAVGGALQTLEPQNNCTSPMITLAYEPLINVAPDGGYRPGLAESWEYTEDNKVFTLHLRDDAAFADGTEVTADNVAKSLQWYKDNPGIISNYMEPISTIEAVDETTVKISYEEPFGGVETLLSNNGECNNGHVISPAGLADPKAMGTKTFGAGPYMLDEADSVSGDTYAYVQNPHYYDASQQHWKKIVIKVIQDPTTAYNALKTGQIQVDMVSQDSLVSQAEADSIDVTNGALAGPGMMIWDLNGEATAALSDVRVRQALAYAIDRDALARAVGPTAKPLDQFALAGAPGYVDGLPEAFTYDVEKAKQLLADAGYADGFDMTAVTFTSTDAVGTQVAQALPPYFKAIGVNLTVKPLPDDTFFSEIAKKEYPAGVFSFTLNGDVYFDAMRLYAPPYSDVWNVFRAYPPELEDAWTALALAPPEEYESASQAFNAIATEQVLVVPMVQTFQFVFSKGIEIGKASPNGGFDFASWQPS